MPNQFIEEDRIVASLEQSFSVNKMILYVGADNPEEVVTKEIARLPWNCIITSDRQESFRNLFLDQQRQIREYSVLSDIPANLFEGNTLPIIKLYGKETSGVFDEDDLEMQLEELQDECNKMLTSIMRKLDFTMQLIVIGYHPGAKKEIKRTTFLLRLKECSGAKISFFGLKFNDNETEKLKSSLNKLNIDYYDELLGNMLSRQEIEVDNGSNWETKTDDELFYKNGKPAIIKQSNVLRYKEVGVLLTERLLNEVRPYGRIQQSRWFLNFLTRSSIEGPQWYGYLKQTEFYLSRSYEGSLLQLVTDILKGKEGVTKDYSNPVILEGDPASSKSVVLGALAFKVFSSKEFPVIFIDNNRLNTREDIEILDEFMQEIENIGDNDSKILIIWDGASYQNIDSLARNIAKQLDNRGRRFLFVCSAYRNLDFSSEILSKKYKFLKRSGKELVPCKQEEMEIAQEIKRGFYYVHASGELTHKELVELKNKVKLYIPEHKKALSAKWDALEKEGNTRLFDYLYKLIAVLQPPLEMGLDRERKKFVQYAQKQINEIPEDAQPETMNPMREALIKAGFTLEEIEELEEIDNKENGISEEDIHRMNTCIALFTRFKLDCSVRMAIYILRSSLGENAYTEVYSTENRNLLKIITSSMPWIHYKPNADGVFCFYYRSSLEAEIFLTNSNITPEDEVDMICEMLDFYAEDFRQNDSSDLSLKSSLQKLIRMVGPNSEYFARSWSSITEHKGLMEHLNKIIDKLHWLRTEVGIEDNDASFANIEITFLREYFGTNWNKDKVHEVRYNTPSGIEYKVWDAYPEIFTEDSYGLRLQKLNTAINLANTSIDRLKNATSSGVDKQSVASTINALVVELCQCNIRLEELQKEYQDYCKDKKISKKIEYKSIKPMPYKLLYKMLIKAIHSDPSNGYAYNAIFKLFIKEYEKSDNERKYELLSEIRPLVDDAEAYEIDNRGPAEKDELTKYLSQIRNISSDVKVSIQTLDSRSVDAAFLRLFDDMLIRGNASVIAFVCQQELDNANLSANKAYDSGSGENINSQLKSSQISKCKEICDFMRRKEYATCIESDANALYLQLKVTWMAFNGHPLLDRSVECRPTYLSKNQWIEINRLCVLYDRCAGNTRRPVVVLLQALSVIHISGDYKEANRILESLREDMFFLVSRMRVPFMLCNEDGTPWKFSGIVVQVEDQRHRGYIKVDGVPFNMGTKKGIRFYQKNLGRKSMPHFSDVLYELEMGIGYMGFSMYTEAGRNRLEVR